MYNANVLGWRLNEAERAISPASAARLQEKWRFPSRDSGEEIGVVHATPIVVNGHVYFGTASDPAFYKLAPDGTLKWVYRNPAHRRAVVDFNNQRVRASRFQPSLNGILGSALVTSECVFYGDLGGWFYALDRTTGQERWKVNSRSAAFPGAHALNCFFASPILAEGCVIAAGGTLEQMAAALPVYKAASGRGFVVAFELGTGKIAWKFDLGPEPKPLDPPLVITDSWGKHAFHYGPGTSSIWSTPSFDAQTHTLYFGTDVNTSPRRPTPDNPRTDTPESCAIVALDARDGSRKWVTQLSPGDVWTNAMRAYNPEEGRYKDQSIGDTPKILSIHVDGRPMSVVGVGSKNGAFYLLNAADGAIVAHTPLYTGPPAYPLSPPPDKRMLALPSPIGGLQTGCATDGRSIFTNGIDALQMGTLEKQTAAAVPPTGGRVVCLSTDLQTEHWRHERPKIARLGGPPPAAVYTNVGDPVASGIAVANGVLFFTTVASGKLVALNAANGQVLKELALGPVWSGPSVSRGRVYVGTGNTLLSSANYESYFPKQYTGALYSFGIPEEDEVDRLGRGNE
jgi:outer membrane protein assembly factor BamB